MGPVSAKRRTTPQATIQLSAVVLVLFLAAIDKLWLISNSNQYRAISSTSPALIKVGWFGFWRAWCRVMLIYGYKVWTGDAVVSLLVPICLIFWLSRGVSDWVPIIVVMVEACFVVGHTYSFANVYWHYSAYNLYALQKKPCVVWNSCADALWFAVSLAGECLGLLLFGWCITLDYWYARLRFEHVLCTSSMIICFANDSSHFLFVGDVSICMYSCPFFWAHDKNWAWLILARG